MIVGSMRVSTDVIIANPVLGYRKIEKKNHTHTPKKNSTCKRIANVKPDCRSQI